MFLIHDFLIGFAHEKKYLFASLLTIIFAFFSLKNWQCLSCRRSHIDSAFSKHTQNKHTWMFFFAFIVSRRIRISLWEITIFLLILLWMVIFYEAKKKCSKSATIYLNVLNSFGAQFPQPNAISVATLAIIDSLHFV